MFVSNNSWITEAYKQEAGKKCHSIKDGIILAMQTKGKTIQLVKKCFKKDSQEKKTGTVQKKANAR